MGMLQHRVVKSFKAVDKIWLACVVNSLILSELESKLTGIREIFNSWKVIGKTIKEGLSIILREIAREFVPLLVCSFLCLVVWSVRLFVGLLGILFCLV